MARSFSPQNPDEYLQTLKRVSVAILSYNRCSELEETLTQLYKKGDLWCEVIVGDNASTDGSRAMVREQFPQVKVLNTGGNHGIVGSNLAYTSAVGDWVLSLDDDSHPVIESLAPVCRAIENGCVAAAIALSVRKKWIPAEKSESEVVKPAFGFSSAGVLFNRKAIREIGAYDPELFLFTNELHWTARALSKGWEVAACDHSVVIHRSAPANRSSWRHAHFYCRNTLLFLLRYAPKRLLPKLLTGFLRDIWLFTLLHGSGVYLKALAEARKLQKAKPWQEPRLSIEQFHAIKPDLRAPFSYLG